MQEAAANPLRREIEELTRVAVLQRRQSGGRGAYGFIMKCERKIVARRNLYKATLSKEVHIAAA